MFIKPRRKVLYDFVHKPVMCVFVNNNTIPYLDICVRMCVAVLARLLFITMNMWNCLYSLFSQLCFINSKLLAVVK